MLLRPIAGHTALHLPPCRALAVLLADPWISATIYAADEVGNLTQPQCDRIMERIFGCPHPRYAKKRDPQYPGNLLYPQRSELTTSGVVIYLARK